MHTIEIVILALAAVTLIDMAVRALGLKWPWESGRFKR